MCGTVSHWLDKEVWRNSECNSITVIVKCGGTVVTLLSLWYCATVPPHFTITVTLFHCSTTLLSLWHCSNISALYYHCVHTYNALLLLSYYYSSVDTFSLFVVMNVVIHNSTHGGFNKLMILANPFSRVSIESRIPWRFPESSTILWTNPGDLIHVLSTVFFRSESVVILLHLHIDSS